VSLTEDSKADVDGNVDQRAAVVAGGGGLVTLGLAESSNTAVDGDVDQSVGGGLLLALGITEDGSAETNGDADEVLSGHDALYQILVSCIFVVHSMLVEWITLHTEQEAARATREGIIVCFILSKRT